MSRRPLMDKPAYDRDGFAIVRNAVPQDLIAAIMAEAVTVCRTYGPGLPESHQRRPAMDIEDVAHLSNDELLSKYLAIHFPHKLSTLFHDVLSHSAIVNLLRTVIGPNVKCMQSMLFIKSPGSPGQAWHQDEAFIPTRDRSLTGVWLALDDATEDNGCLWAIPGSHRGDVIYPVRDHGSPEWDSTRCAYDFPEDGTKPVPLVVPSGSLIVFNGYVLHASYKNRSSRYRRVLVNHYMSAESLLPWNQGGRLAAEQDFRDIVMVCGDDPYAYKGTEDISEPYVRTAV